MSAADAVRESAMSRSAGAALTREFSLAPPSTRDDCYVRINSDSLHELNGPVNQIVTLVELLRQRYGGKLDSEAETLVGFIQTSAAKLQHMMGGLRSYVRLACAPGPHRKCDANQLLVAACASLQMAIEQDKAAITHDPLPEIECDPAQITCVFTCLIENAIKYRGAVHPVIHISAAPGDIGWVFSVHDNGPGVESSVGDRIFALFKRARHAEIPGAGVGLALARQIIDQHGGRIWVDSQPNSGTTFYFSLPRAA